MYRLVFAVVLLPLMAANIAARDVFVNNVGGDDRQNGATPSSNTQGNGPVRSIARALRLADKGDRVILANTGEAYRESITLQGRRQSGYPGRPFELIGNGAVIDGSIPIPRDAWEHVSGNVFRFSPRLKSFQQMFLDGLPLTRRVAEEGKVPELRPLEWSLFDRKIYFHAEKGRLPQDYNLTYAGLSVGITLYEVRHVVVRDLTVQGFQLDGVNAHDSVFDASIEGTVCRGNGRSGISIGGSSRLRVDSCLVGNNGAAQVRAEGYSKTWIIDCDLLDNTAPRIVKEGDGVFVQETSDDETTAK